MRQLGIQGVSRRGKKPRTTVPDQKQPPAADYRRRFNTDPLTPVES
jgi:hypothetical protein